LVIDLDLLSSKLGNPSFFGEKKYCQSHKKRHSAILNNSRAL
jgi:hypothetical protein